MFIDYLSLLLVNMVAALIILALYVWRGVEEKDQKKWVAGFGVTGFIALLFGTHMTLNWPLPGSYNVAFGEASVLLGVLLSGAAVSLAFGWGLESLAACAFIFGLTAAVIGMRIIVLHMTQGPVLTGIGFILTGLSGVFIACGLYGKKSRMMRTVVVVMLVISAVIWAMTGFQAYWGHVSVLSKWVPVLMR